MSGSHRIRDQHSHSRRAFTFYLELLYFLIRIGGTLWQWGVFEIAVHNSYENDDGTVIRLTEREIEVLKLILEGKSSKEAAAILCCSKRTVDFHLARVYQKLDVSNRVQAMRRVAVLGLIPLADTDDGGDGRHN